MNHIQKYLVEHRKTQADLARITGEQPPVICKLIKGRMKISMRMAGILEYGTDGVLKAEEICARAHERELIRFLKTGQKTQDGQLALEMEQTK